MTDKNNPFAYWVDPEDRPDTPEKEKRLNSIRFYYWKSTGVKPEDLTGDIAKYREEYAAYLKSS
jgi:hypothetical protein